MNLIFCVDLDCKVASMCLWCFITEISVRSTTSHKHFHLAILLNLSLLM